MIHASFSPRALALAAGLALGLAFAAPQPAAAQSVTVTFSGQPMYLDPGPIERAGRVFVPLRSIFERMGAGVVYSNGTINATKGNTTVSLHIGSTQATVNGQVQYLDVAPFIVGATTYVPLRFIAQSLGANVGYDGSTRVVSITGGGYRPAPHPVPPPPRPPNPPPASGLRLTAQQPAPGAVVTNRFATIAAAFTVQAAPGSVRVWLDGADRTAQSGVSRDGFSYKPPAPLGFGSHTVEVGGVDAYGARFDRSWSFTVVGAAPPPVAPVTLRAQQPAPGASVANRFAVISAEFSSRVQPGSVRVWLDGADRTSQSGVSAAAFSYKPPAPLDFGSHAVRVTGRDAAGNGFDRSWSFSVARPAPNVTVTISQPSGDAAVGTDFVVRGSTVPNARIAITAGAGAPATGQFSGTTTAGGLGNFSLRVTFTPMPGQQVVRVKIKATDPAGGQSKETVLQLRIR